MHAHECHYCDGTGIAYLRVDVDGYREVECEYCEGTGASRHSANTRTYWTGPLYWLGGHPQIGDPLVLTARMRTAYLRKRNAWDGNYAAQLYGEIRQLAVSPVCLPDLEQHESRMAA